MPKKFTDNALTTLAANLAIGATTMTVAGGAGVLFAAVNDFFDETDGQYVTLIRASDGAIEVILITNHDGAADVIATIFRDVQGVHGGVGLAFVTADVVDARIPAELLDGFAQVHPDSPTPGAASMHLLRNGDSAPGAQTQRSVAIGPGTTVEGGRTPDGDDCVVIGHNAAITNSNPGRGVIIGSGASSPNSNVVGIGRGAVAAGDGVVVIGSGSRANGADGITVGNNSIITDDRPIWIGGQGVPVGGGTTDAIVIGHDHDLSGGSNEDRSVIIGKGITDKISRNRTTCFTQPIAFNTTGAIGVSSIVNNGCEIVVCTDVFDWKNATHFIGGAQAFHSFDFDSAAGSVFFVESVEAWLSEVLVGAFTTGVGFKVGTTFGGTEIIAGSTTSTSLILKEREQFPSILLNKGANRIWFEITSAATGPTLARGCFIIRGTLYTS